MMANPITNRLREWNGWAVNRSPDLSLKRIAGEEPMEGMCKLNWIARLLNFFVLLGIYLINIGDYLGLGK